MYICFRNFSYSLFFFCLSTFRLGVTQKRIRGTWWLFLMDYKLLEKDFFSHLAKKQELGRDLLQHSRVLKVFWLRHFLKHLPTYSIEVFSVNAKKRLPSKAYYRERRAWSPITRHFGENAVVSYWQGVSAKMPPNHRRYADRPLHYPITSLESPLLYF